MVRFKGLLLKLNKTEGIHFTYFIPVIAVLGLCV